LAFYLVLLVILFIIVKLDIIQGWYFLYPKLCDSKNLDFSWSQNAYSLPIQYNVFGFGSLSVVGQPMIHPDPLHLAGSGFTSDPDPGIKKKNHDKFT